MNSSDGSAQNDGVPSGRDSFLSWEHLVLLLTPFPILFVSRVGWILGLNNDAADRIWAIWITPAFFVSFITAFVGPVVFLVVLLFLVGRNIWHRRPKRLVLYGTVLLVLPAIMRFWDADYLRFKLQEPTFAASVAKADKQDGVTQCFVFDQIVDNFYIGGANFDPYEKWILHAADGGPDRAAPRIDSLLLGSECLPFKAIKSIRHLTGKYYLAIATRQY